MTDYRGLILSLVSARVEFIVVGGAAATAHGSARLTEDMDIVYRRSRQNVLCLVEALAPLEPYPRGTPAGLPFSWDERTIWNGLNFTLITKLGALDLFGEIVGGGDYQELLPYSITLRLYGAQCLCLGLERLIYVKRAAGRPKDMEILAELEAIREEAGLPGAND